jgi:hypothetical protein
VAASQGGAVAAAALHDIAVLAVDAGTPATRAGADRLWPSTAVGSTTVDDITRKFFHLMFVYMKNMNKH